MIWFVALGMVVQAGINWWLIQRARAARNDNRTLVRSLDTVQRVAAQAVTPEELRRGALACCQRPTSFKKQRRQAGTGVCRGPLMRRSNDSSRTQVSS